MNKEDKELLLKDLCGRLPYGVKIKYAIPTLLVSIRNDRDGIKVITEGTYGEHIYNIEDIKPYLRPLSSMTEEEKHELYNIRPYFINSDDIVSGTQCNTFIQASECQDWLNAHHFDYRGLIPKGLALEAPENMYTL